jgi:hypothetical protein
MNAQASNPDSKAYEYATIFYAVGYLFVLGFAWIIKYHSVVASIPTPEGCGKFPSICALVESLGGNAHPRGGAIATVIFFFLVATNLRIILASMLCHSTRSPLRRAVCEAGKGLLRRLILLYGLIKVIALTSLWRAYVIGVNEPWLLPIALQAESLLILLFDAIFLKEMKSIRNYRLILWLDLGSFIFALVWLALAAQSLERPDEWWGTIFFASFSSLAFLFIVITLTEIWGYLVLFWQSLRDLRVELQV